MSVNETIATTLSSSSGLTSFSGYDTETGNTEINLPLTAFPANSNAAAFSLAFNAAAVQLVYLCATQNCTIFTNGLNTADIQTISITGTPTGGFFPLAWDGLCTALAYNTNASTAQTAIQTMVGSGNCNCSGGPLPGTPIVCTFAGALNTGYQQLMTSASSGLTGGTSPTVSVAHSTPGQPTNTIELTAGIPLVWGKSAGYGSSPFGNSINVNAAALSCNASTLLNARILTL